MKKDYLYSRKIFLFEPAGRGTIAGREYAGFASRLIYTKDATPEQLKQFKGYCLDMQFQGVGAEMVQPLKMAVDTRFFDPGGSLLEDVCILFFTDRDKRAHSDDYQIALGRLMQDYHFTLNGLWKAAGDRLNIKPQIGRKINRRRIDDDRLGIIPNKPYWDIEWDYTIAVSIWLGIIGHNPRTGDPNLPLNTRLARLARVIQTSTRREAEDYILDNAVGTLKRFTYERAHDVLYDAEGNEMDLDARLDNMLKPGKDRGSFANSKDGTRITKKPIQYLDERVLNPPPSQAYTDLLIEVDDLAAGETPINKNIVRLLASGYSQPVIAKMVGLSYSATRTEIKRMRERMNAKRNSGEL